MAYDGCMCGLLYGHLFVAIIFSFVMIEFLTVACCCCCDRYFICHDIVLLSCTTKFELYVVIDL